MVQIVLSVTKEILSIIPLVYNLKLPIQFAPKLFSLTSTGKNFIIHWFSIIVIICKDITFKVHCDV